MIYVTGDTHGDWMSRLNMNAFPEQKQMTKDDYVIICGDFGIWDNSKRENYNLDWLNSRNFSTLFIDGNHSNFNILNNLPVEEWHGGNVSFVRDSVIHLKRGQVFEVDGRKIFTFGGASSHDIQDGILDPDDFDDYDEFRETWKQWDKQGKMFRVKNITWWSEELPNQDEMMDGIHNLEEHDWKVDYIITHSPSASMLTLLGANGLYEQDVLTKYLEEIRCNTEYNRWFMGHMHINKALNDKDILLYEQIVRIL